MGDATLTERLKTDLAPRAKALDADNEKQKPALEQVASGVVLAIRDRDQKAMRGHAKVLQGLIADYATLKSQADRLVADLDAVHSDDPKEQKLVDGLQAMAKQSQGKIDRNYAKLKAIMADAHAHESDPEYDALMKDWAAMEALLNAQQKVAALRVAQMKTLAELARDSAAAGDAKSFTQAQQKAKERHG